MKDIVIIGAGPYGLSTAAYLQEAGVAAHVIGQPMAFWKRHMPAGMLLRSRIEASNIAAPQGRLSLEAYQRVVGRTLAEPLPVEDFIAYGDWFQAQVVPHLDTRHVVSVSRHASGFAITFADGDRCEAGSVVLALGIGLFCQRPEQFAGVPRELAPHTSDLSDPSQFRGKRVAVIGRGQSALEYAALLHEHQAIVMVLTRSAAVNFLSFAWRKHLFRRLTPGPLRPLSYVILPPTDLGDIRTARKMADPEKFRRQSHEVQKDLLKDVTTPRGAYWLPSRLTGVPLRTGVSVDAAQVVADGLELALSDGTTERVDRVVLATGYRVDVSKYHILDASLRREIQTTHDGYPILTMGLQTSVDGLYMAGVIGERTLGPTLRFVTGTSNSGPRLAAAITGQRSVHQS
jgi:thioredoxin reductase